MKTYQAVKAEIKKLEAKAEALRKTELKSIIAQVRKTIAEFGLTAADLGLGRAAAKGRGAGRRAAKGVAKYRDPKTGQTWTGHGRPPAWIVAAKDRNALLIDGAAAAGAAPAKKARRAARPAGKAAKATKTAKTAKAPARKRAGKARAPRKTGAVQIESGVASE